jgi:EAL and modified HD-GYP domain-containing signal transduction protein
MVKKFIARQPIYKRGTEVVGYELLCRDSDLAEPAFKDGNAVAAQSLVQSFVDNALDKVAGEDRAFVPVTRDFLLSPFAESLPKGRVVLEIPGDTVVDKPLVDSVARLSKKGYWVALDGFVDADQAKPLAKFAKFARLDVRAEGWDAVVTQFLALKKLGLKLVARNVDTPEDYAFSTKLGFDLCQGFFYCKPDPTLHKQIPFNRMSTIYLLTKLQDPDISPRELEHAVGQDVAITYRVLRYLNSPAYAFPKKIESIRHAVALVGTGLLSNWSSAALLGSIENKPRELMVTGIVRAHMCQQLGEAMHQKNTAQFFTAGLLSVVDALLDRPLRDALMLLPMADAIKDALLQHKGPMGEALTCIKTYERADWENTRCGNLSEKVIRDTYLNSLVLTRGITQEFAA